VKELRDAAIGMARAAGRAINQRFARGGAVAHKGTIDLVTDADRAAEEAILELLQKRFPDHAVLAEESGASGRWNEHDAEIRWIIDPLDGTTNYANSIPHFAVLLAAQQRSAEGYQTVAAVTLDPLRAELFSARRGAGARLNDEPVRVSETNRLIDAVVATGFAYDRLFCADDNHAEFCRLNFLTRGVRRFGAAGLDFAWVACGRFDGFWERGLNPWDVTGGALLVSEAGGTVTDYQGGPFAIDGRRVLASNGRLHEPMIRALADAARLPANAREGLAEQLPPEVAERIIYPESSAR